VAQGGLSRNSHRFRGGWLEKGVALKDSPASKHPRDSQARCGTSAKRLGRPRSPIATATARILSGTEQTEVQPTMDRKFGWLKMFFALI